MGKLYMVGPMGEQKDDVPFRGLRVLRESSLIVTRNSGVARERFGRWEICTPMVEISGCQTFAILVAALQAGDVAWLVIRLAELDTSARCLLDLLLMQGIEPLSVPGPSDEIAALAVSGLPVDSVTFLGMLPERSKERRPLFRDVAGEHQTIVCEVTADGLQDVLVDVLACLGDRQVVLSGESEQLIGPLGFSFNSHGVANGWANFPLNYDPVWMQGECKLHKCVARTPRRRVDHGLSK